MASCSKCKGRDGAHFHWCPRVAPPEVRPPAPVLEVPEPPEVPVVASTCPDCKGTRGAHFHWCVRVGGKGSPAAQRQALARIAYEEEARRHAEEVAEAERLLKSGVFHRVVPPPADLPEPHLTEIRREAQDRAIDAAMHRASICTACGQAGGRHATNCEPCSRCGMRGAHKQDCSRRGIMPRLRVVPPAPRLEEPPRPAWRWSGEPPNWDEISGFDLDSTAHDMLTACMSGLPAEIPYMIRDDVMALEGFDETAVVRALREPDNVQIRPETAEKKYPVLGFRRGDVVAILGMRTPRTPAIIAAYWTSLLSGWDPSAHRDRTGGGGSKASGGLPTTPKACVKRLKMMGAAVAIDPTSVSATTAEVTYEGQALGKISIGERVSRDVVESDYQRMQRKIHAIDLRLNSVKGHQS